MDYSVSMVNSGMNQGKWVCKFRDFDGKIKKRICKGCKTKKQALDFVKSLGKKKQNPYLIKEIAKDMFIEGGEHLQRLEGFGRKPSAETISQRRFITLQIITDFGEYDISKLLLRDIESFLIRDKKHSGSWKNFYLSTFACIYEETKWKCPTHIPKPQFQQFKRNSKKCDVLSTKELDLIFQPCWWDSYSEYLFFICIASCGLRIGEARALKVNQFLFDRKILIVNGFCKRDGTRTTYNKKGSVDDDKIRVVPIPDDAVKLIFNYIHVNNRHEEDFVFQTDEGKPMDQVHMEHVFKVVLKRAGIKTAERKIVPHSLRFTYVTRMRRGLSIEDVQKLVGHSSIEMTQYYTRSSIPELIASVQGTFTEANNLFIDSGNE